MAYVPGGTGDVLGKPAPGTTLGTAALKSVQDCPEATLPKAIETTTQETRKKDGNLNMLMISIRRNLRKEQEIR
jgi:hypothetical protein